MVYLHGILMSISFLIMAAGISAASFGRKKHWWFKLHKRAGIIGPIFMIPGLAAAYVSVAYSGGEHLQIPHAWAGIAAAITIFITQTAGTLQLTMPRSASLKVFHRWIGRTGITLMLLTAASGLYLVLG